MHESLLHIDKSCIFRETFNSAFEVMNNRYAKGTINGTGIRFENGAAKFDGAYITYNTPRKKIAGYTVNILINIDRYPSAGNVFRLTTLSGSAIISSGIDPSGQLFTNAGNIYLNGKSTPSIMPLNTWCLITWIVASYDVGKYNKLFIASNPAGGEVFHGKIEKVDIYNRSFPDSEIKLYNQNQLYSQSLNLPLLLDFDSTRGVIEDRTGLNSLAPSNVSIQRTGKVYSAYFNGSSGSNIVVNRNLLIDNFTLSGWVKLTSNRNAQYALNTSNYSFYIATDGTLAFRCIRISTVQAVYSTIESNPSKKWVYFIIYFKSGDTYKVGSSQFIGTISDKNPNANNTATSMYIGQFAKGFIPKLQIFQGLPSPNVQDQFAAQLYNSQKGMFGL